MNAKTQLQEVKERLAQLDPNNRDNLVEIARLKTREAELVNQAALEDAQLHEKEQRDQRQQEMIQTTTSVDILAQMFDSLLPAGQFEVILGPNRYDVLSQDYKQMIQAYVTEALQAAHQQHDLELAQKDERIKLLNDQSLSVQQQLDAANATLEQKHKDFMDAQTAADTIRAKAKQDYADHMANTTHLMKQLDEKDATIADLQNKLEAAQQPKAEAKPSQSLSEMMTAIKSKNEVSADDWLARWNARQKSDDVKIPLPEVKVPAVTESPFRPDNQTQLGSDQLPSAETAETVGARFPEVSPISPPVAESTSDVGGTGAEAHVTRSEFDELKRAVDTLYVMQRAVEDHLGVA